MLGGVAMRENIADRALELEKRLGGAEQPSEADIKEAAEQTDEQTNLLFRLPAAFNSGIALSLGVASDLLSTVQDMGRSTPEEFEHLQVDLPTGREIQEGMAKMGLTYHPDEQPDEIVDRAYRYLGAAATVPIGYKSALGRALSADLLGATGAAAGGKAAEQTTWADEHPEIARGIGELLGGFGAASPGLTWQGIKGIATRLPGISSLRQFKGEPAIKRAIHQLNKKRTSPVAELSNRLRQADERVDAASAVDDPGIASMDATIRKRIPREKDLRTIHRDETRDVLTQELERPGEPGVADVRAHLENISKRAHDDVEEIMRPILASDQPHAYSTQAVKRIRESYNEAQDELGRAWRNAPDAEPQRPTNIVEAYKDELRAIGPGGDIQEIPEFVKRKLGTRLGKDGDLKGGEFYNQKRQTVRPKDVHDFHSRLGRLINQLDETGGNPNTIRIIQRLRENAFNDLDNMAVGKRYRELKDMTKDVKGRFEHGDLGRLLGFQRGKASSDAVILRDLIAQPKGVTPRENINQVLQANPQTERDISNFLRSKFGEFTVNEHGRINTSAANQFFKKHDDVLNIFPSLKTELKEATRRQARVDTLEGARHVNQVSPKTRENSAAGIMLRANAGEEMDHLIKNVGRTGDITKKLSEMKNITATDPTGKATKGLKNAAIEQLMRRSMKYTEPVRGETAMSGRVLTENIRKMEKPLKDANILTQGEIDRLKQIGRSLRGQQRVEQATAPGTAVMEDMPGRALDLLMRGIGANIGPKVLRSAHAGGSIQQANIGARAMEELRHKLTRDEALNYLVEATRDPQVMRDAITRLEHLDEREAMRLIDRIVDVGKRTGGGMKSTLDEVRRQTPRTAFPGPAEQFMDAGQEKMEKSQKIQRLKDRLNME